MKTQSIRTTKTAIHMAITSLVFALTLAACDFYDTRPQTLADALGATSSNTLASFKFKQNITDRYQHIYFEHSSEMTTELIEKAVKSIDSGATIRTGASLSDGEGLSNNLDLFWSKGSPNNLRLISGKDIFRNSVQNTSWLINWSNTRNPRISDVLVYYITYDATKVALEIDGHSITNPIIIIQTSNQ